MSKGNDLVPLVVDLNELKSNKLNEVFLRIFGEYIKKILGRTFGGPEIPVTVRGKRSDVAALAQLLAQERRYMESYLKYGLDVGVKEVKRNHVYIERDRMEFISYNDRKKNFDKLSAERKNKYLKFEKWYLKKLDELTKLVIGRSEFSS